MWWKTYHRLQRRAQAAEDRVADDFIIAAGRLVKVGGAMQLFKTASTLQRFVSYHRQVYNHFNHEKHLQNRQTYKQKRSTALTE